MTHRRPSVALASFVLIAACGGADPATTTTTTSATSTTSGGTATATPQAPHARPGATPETAVQRCGPRDSYFYVATKFKCADGHNPLNGDLEAGAGSRSGNVGEGPDGHILDLYVVPCASGPVQVYVDMYHCRPGQGTELGID